MRGVLGVEVTEDGVWSVALVILDTEAKTPGGGGRRGSERARTPGPSTPPRPRNWGSAQAS